jgi:hypothetical protein
MNSTPKRNRSDLARVAERAVRAVLSGSLANLAAVIHAGYQP